ncbi:MAG TPA: hypothetical protein VLA89_04525 [Gemmatimonadales bacterium]|nr:hypothetical protein [Gemmatimonadales bacterium]
MFDIEPLTDFVPDPADRPRRQITVFYDDQLKRGNKFFLPSSKPAEELLRLADRLKSAGVHRNVKVRCILGTRNGHRGLSVEVH